MKWIIAILVVVAVLLLLGLIWTSMKRKRDRVARERAGELRSHAAGTVLDQHEQEARARQTQAEAERAKAEADQLEVQAAKEQTAYDQTRAQREDALREADRLDPDVDHRSDDYAPDLDGGTPTQRVDPGAEQRTGGPTTQQQVGEHQVGEHQVGEHQVTDPAADPAADPRATERGSHRAPDLDGGAPTQRVAPHQTPPSEPPA